MRRIILSIALFAMASPAIASQTDKGVTSQILTVNNVTAFFEQNGSRSTRPACATMTRWAIDVSNAAGQAMLAHLLAMNAQHRSVYVTGSGDCSTWADSETVAGIMDAD